MKIQKDFFSRNAKTVAKELLGKILVRKINNKEFRAKIVETEAYFGKEDPASRASKGKNKVSEMMCDEPGKILVYNVHKYKMFNIVTGKKNEPSAVLIRALEPINFTGRCNGPGLLSGFLEIEKSFHGQEIFSLENIWIENSTMAFKIAKSYRI